MAPAPSRRGVRDRRMEAELMDAPDVDPVLHAQALRALARVGALSRSTDRVWRPVRRLALRAGRPVRVLDLACGGGDVPIGIARRAARAGLAVEAHGIDRSPFAVAWARERAARLGASVTFSEGDVLGAPLPTGYDVVTCSLFLHHLTRPEACDLLRAMAACAPLGLVQDLRRSRLGLALAWGTLRVVTRSRIARVDGVRSVRAAFTVAEVGVLARDAGLGGARVRRAWPQRLVLRWGDAA